MMTGSQAEGVLLCLAPGGGKQERGAAAASGQGYLEVYRRDENL